MATMSSPQAPLASAIPIPIPIPIPLPTTSSSTTDSSTLLESDFDSDTLLDAVLDPGEPATLQVFRDNARARRFYARNGFVPDGTEAEEPHWGGVEIGMVRSDPATDA